MDFDPHGVVARGASPDELLWSARTTQRSKFWTNTPQSLRVRHLTMKPRGTCAGPRVNGDVGRRPTSPLDNHEPASLSK